MKIDEFIKVFCSDIVKDFKTMFYFDDNDDFSYDKITNVNGVDMKVVVADDGTEIPILEILDLEEEDFVKFYPSPESLKMYKRYLENFIILSGEEALNEFRDRIKLEKERLEKYRKMDMSDVARGF